MIRYSSIVGLLISVLVFCSCLQREKQYSISKVGEHHFRESFFDIESDKIYDDVTFPIRSDFFNKDSTYELLLSENIVKGDTLLQTRLKQFNIKENSILMLNDEKLNLLIEYSDKSKGEDKSIYKIALLDQSRKILTQDTLSFLPTESAYFYLMDNYLMVLSKYYVSNGNNYNLSFYNFKKN